MSIRFIPHTARGEMVRLLNRQGTVYAPVTGADHVARFEACNREKLPDLSITRTMLPPKKYLLHPRETILNYHPHDGYREPDCQESPWFLLGVHPCDLAGIAWLDRLLLGGEPDRLYAARRAALTLIGVSCTADLLCSCEQAHSSLPSSCDLFLHLMDGGWGVTLHSERGEAVAKLLEPLIQVRECAAPPDCRRFFGTQNGETAPPEPDWNHPGWHALADACLGCGACSVVCPTCSCFDVQEQGGLDETGIQRLRSWDNCLLASHSRVAGGEHFQKNRLQRFQYRYRHKYLGFGALRGIVSCTGCGRCRAFCPAKLDLRSLAYELQGGTP